jgi:hypothetical protein
MKRKRLQQDAVYETEDRSVCTDAERERDHCNQCESRLLQENTQAVAKILE